MTVVCPHCKRRDCPTQDTGTSSMRLELCALCGRAYYLLPGGFTQLPFQPNEQQP
jgi:hypothetical protein